MQLKPHNIILATALCGILFLAAPVSAGSHGIYHRPAVILPSAKSKSHEHDSELEDEIDQQIDEYFTGVKSTSSVDVDEQKLKRLFGKRKTIVTPDPGEGKSNSFSFSNTNNKNGSGYIRSHTVKKGDTIYSISRLYTVKPHAVLKHNPALRNRPLYIGEEVLISLKRNARVRVKHRTKYYRVKRGDSLSVIGRKFRVSVRSLRSMNRLRRKSTLRVGQKLMVSRRKSRVVPKGYRFSPVFVLPVKARITSRFGRRYNPFIRKFRSFHKGIDLGASLGTPYHAARSGMVVRARRMGGYGNCIFIRHANGYVSVYAHSKAILVKEGQVVKQGQLIGYVGRTGNATGPHLHFEIRKRKRAINPLAAFRLKELVPVRGIRKTALRSR